jgi:methyl-accepting chemotaxis protein
MNLLSVNRRTAFFTVLALVAVVGIIIMATLQYRAMSDYRQLGETRVLVSDIQADVLTLRRNEKDFLARKDLLYRQKFVDNFNLLQANVKELRSGLQKTGVEDKKLKQLDEILKMYQSRFLKMVELQKAIGFHHEDGFYGRLRHEIHQVERILQMLRQDQLIKDMLMLRRQEKDFMLRKDAKYIDKFDMDMVVMRSDVSNAYIDHRVKKDIFSALTAYEKDFKALVSATQEMGFSSNDGLHGEMRSGIHQGERLLSELRQDLLLRESSAGSSMINQIIAFAVVLTLLIGAFIRL